MKQIKTRCPKCGALNFYKNYFVWILKTPFQWFGKRYAKCNSCWQSSFMEREEVTSKFCAKCKNDICKVYGGSCFRVRFIEFLRKIFG